MGSVEFPEFRFYLRRQVRLFYAADRALQRQEPVDAGRRVDLLDTQPDFPAAEGAQLCGVF